LKRKENEEADKRGALEMKVAKLEAKLKLKENEVRILHSAMANVTSGFSRFGSNDQSESAFTLFALDEGFGIGAVASSLDLRSNDESLQSVGVKGFGHEPRPAVHSSTQPMPELQALESLFPRMHLRRNHLVSIVSTSGLLEAGAAGGGGSGCPSPIITSTPSSSRWLLVRGTRTTCSEQGRAPSLVSNSCNIFVL